MSSSARCATQADAISPRLLRAYRLTRYRAEGYDIVIGRRVPDALLRRLGARGATLVTAWNPRSHRMPDGWNRRMQRQLRQRLRRATVVDAKGSLKGWHEKMLLVPGDWRPCIRLAIRFRQRAVVILSRGQKARLRLL
jgi:Mg-chelatase subunit ChlD